MPENTKLIRPEEHDILIAPITITLLSVSIDTLALRTEHPISPFLGFFAESVDRCSHTCHHDRWANYLKASFKVALVFSYNLSEIPSPDVRYPFFFPRHFSFVVLFQDQRCLLRFPTTFANMYTLSDSCIKLSYKTERLRAALDAEDCTYDSPDSVPGRIGHSN